jgi:hypothetical protein
MKPPKVGDTVRIISHSVKYKGVVERKDPILGPKRIIGYWYIVRYLETENPFCIKGDTGLFLKEDLEKV